MRNFGKQNRKDRPVSILLRRSPGGGLPHNQFVIAIVYLTGLIFGPVLLFSYGCSGHAAVSDGLPEAPPPIQAESSSLRVSVVPGGTFSMEEADHLDILLYESDGLGKLVTSCRTSVQELDSVTFPCTDGAVNVVVLANLPGHPNTAVLDRFDTVELLQSGFADDDPGHRIASGCGRVDVCGDCVCEIVLTPLMSRITLASVTNSMKGYILLEDPRVRLTRVNPTAEVLRQDGFRPSACLDALPGLRLPCDVGFYTQYPETDLWCYPNDTPESTLGIPRTGIEFECEINGRTCVFPSDLPPIPRDAVIRADLTVDSPEDWTWTFH